MIQKIAHFAAIPEGVNNYGCLFAVLEDGATYYCTLEPGDKHWAVLPPVPETEAAVRDEAL